MTTATLLVIQGVDLGARFELGDGPAGIGRGVRNKIRIIDTEVSRRHALIDCVEGGYRITDRESSNGTYVNGQPTRQHMLVSGDRIQVGRTILAYGADLEASSQMAMGMIDIVPRDSVDESQIVNELQDSDASSLMESVAGMHSDVGSATSLRALYQISEEVVRPAVSIEEVLQRILRLTIKSINADRGCILVADPETDQVVPRVFAGREAGNDNLRMTVSQTIVDYVLNNGQGVRTSDARRDERFEQGKSIIQAGIREAMCVPMPGHAALMGVVYVDTTTPPENSFTDGTVEKFTAEHLRWLAAVGRQAALAIESSRYQRALMKAERLAAMGQTIAMLSHHIKNILQGVRGGSYLIDLGLSKSDEPMVRKGWGIVERNQGKIYHLVMDMLTFSKEREPAMQLAQLNTTLQDVGELMQARATECGIAFQTEFEQLPESFFDPEGVHRAVLNIVTNAIDAVESQDGGVVRIESRFDQENDSLLVSVSDNGPGIAEDHIDEIFNIFKSTKGARGTGIGLAVSRKIMREHGGEISVDSRPNEGACFTLLWPRMDEDPQAGDGQVGDGPISDGPISDG